MVLFGFTLGLFGVLLHRVSCVSCRLSVFLPVCLSVCLSVGRFVGLAVGLAVRLPVCPSVCLSGCPCVSRFPLVYLFVLSRKSRFVDNSEVEEQQLDLALCVFP